MAKRWINLAGKDLDRWDNTPLLERKMIISKALRGHHEIENFNSEEGHLKLDILAKKHKVFGLLKGYIEDSESDLWNEKASIEAKLESLEYPAHGYSKPSINVEEFWNVFLESAQRHLDEDICFDSPTVKEAYRIQDIENGKNGKKVLVERIFAKSSKPSTFTLATVEKAISRLKKSGGEFISVGKFMPVLAQECAMVEIHPHLDIVRFEDPGLPGHDDPFDSGPQIHYTKGGHSY